MKLALIGHQITHSLSPSLYREFLGNELTSYDLLNCGAPSEVPTLEDLSRRYDGVNITSPYKEHFVPQLIIESALVRELGAVNTLAFTTRGVLGTNTDVLAIEEIIGRYKNKHIILLGSGVMARVVRSVCKRQSLSVSQYARKTHQDITKIDLTQVGTPGHNLIINACSRKYIFNGLLNPSDMFWDLNYDFLPHKDALPALVNSYIDGREMLRLQAIAALKFWRENRV
jgi:shikimate dehydrogenase